MLFVHCRVGLVNIRFSASVVLVGEMSTGDGGGWCRYSRPRGRADEVGLAHCPQDEGHLEVPEA